MPLRPDRAAHWHCDHQSLFFTHLYGETHCVGPLYPISPHWPHWGTRLAVGDELAAVLVVVVVVVVLVEVVNVVEVLSSLWSCSSSCSSW